MGKKSNKTKRNQKIFIEPLEQRIMLDGAGASTFLDLIDERSQGDNSNKTTYDVKKFKEIKSEDGSKELPFTNVPRDQLKRKQIVFIDKQVPDYEKLAKSFRKNVEIHFIESNEDGFKKIEKTLENGKKYSAIHIIGHGSAGQILFGNALLTNESIENYKSTLSNIGESLTQKGDILFYGCNIAANDKGEALLKKISNITKADIAASNDLTGKGGDWVLENNYGIVETKNAEVIDYEHFLAYGVSRVTGDGVEKHGADNFKQSGAYDDQHRIMITNERQGISSANINSIRSNYRTSAFYSFGSVSSSNMINSYMVYLNDDTSGRHKTASFTFEGDILGYYFDAEKTIGHDYNWHKNSIFSKPGAVYQGQRTKAVTKGGRELEPGQGDEISISSDNKTLTMKARNGNPGDFIRVITSTPITNRDPTTSGDSGSVNENSYNVTQSLMNHSSDPDGDTLSVSSFDYVDDDGNTTSHTSVPDSSWKGVGTKYGIFRIYNGPSGPVWNFIAAYPGSTNYDADMGSWVSNYADRGATVAQWNNVNALDPGETVTETINYTIADGNGGEATGTITITVTGQNDTPIAVDDVNSVNEGATISTRGNPTRDGVVANDTDVDGDDTVSTFTVNKIKAGYGEHLINRASPVMDPTIVTGTYGTLQMYSDGSYTYSANSEIAGLDEGESVNDIFTYAIKDNSNESELGNIGNTSDYVPEDLENDDPDDDYLNSIGTLTITINGIGGGNNAPVATDDYDTVAEDATITRSSTASGTSNLVVDDTDEDGDDISVVNVRVVSAPDPFSSPPDWNPVTADSNYGSNYTEITGTYGTLRVGANGTYTYVADQDAADPLDPGSPADFVYDEFEIQISDGEATSTSVLSIIVSGVNDDPVGVDNEDEVTYGSTLDRANGSVYDILTNDTDVDGDDNNSNFSVTSITATTASGGAQTTFTGNAETVTGHYGTLVLNSNGSYTYTPNDTTSRNLANGATGDDVFTYTVSDDSGGTDTTATLTITVTGKTPNPLNDTAYVAAGGSISVANDDDVGVDPGGDGINADGDHSGDVLENDSGTSNTVTAILSPTGETGTISTALSGNYGELTINEDGSYTYEANNAAQLGATTATDVFTYTVTDATSGNTGTATITITILGSNDAPTTTDDTGYINENSTLTVDYDIEDENATDDESGTDSDYNNESGDHTGEVLLNDEDPEGATITVTAIRHSEDASTDATSITASTTYSNGSSILGDYGVLTIGADGSYTYNANTANALDDGDTATDVFTYTVSDGSLTATGTLTITIEGINDTPVAQDDFGFIDENETLTVGATADATTDNVYATNTGPITSGAISISNSSNASTTNGDTYSQDLDFNSDGTYAYVGGSRHGLVFKYGLTTAYDFSTIDTVAYDGSTNTDGYQKLDPDVGGVTGISAKPDGTKIFVTGTSGSDIIIKQFSLSTANNLATADTVAYDASSNTDGYKEYTFSDFTSGNAQHSLIFSSDGTKLFTLEVASGNDKLHQYSLATAWDIGSMNHDGSITLQSDVYDPLGLTSDIHTPQGMAFNDDGTKLTILSEGTDKLYQFSLNSAYNINDPVTLEGERSLSGTENTRGLAFNSDGTELTILQHDVSKIDYHQLNLTGTAYEIGRYKETGTTGESTGNVIDTQSSTHYDNDVDDASSLTISAIRTGTEAAGTGNSGTVGSSLTGTYGTLTIQSTGAYTYVANLAATEALDAGDVAIDYFTYTLSDGTATDTAQLTIKVEGVNDAPTTTNDTGYIAEGSTLTVADGDAAVSGTSTGSNSGDVLDNDTDVDITADTSGNVTESSDDALTVTVGGTVTQNGGTDSSGDAVDANGEAATVGSAVTGLYGSLTINSVGSYSYVADNAEALDVGETVTDIFTFPVTDSQGSATTATLTITVIGVNDLPTSADKTVYINENNIDASYSTRTSANITKTFASSDFAFTDADTSDSSISAIKIITLPSSGTLTLSGSAVTEDQEIAVASISSLVYTPTANSESDDSFTFKVSDGTAFSAVANTISISNNAAPVATDRTHSTAIAPSATTETFNLYSSHVADSDDADSVLTITGVASGSESSTIPDGNVGSSISGSYGTLTLNSDGTYSYTASATNSIAAGQTDTDVFNYTVKDDEANSGSKALDVGQLTFTVSSSTTDPVPADDTGYINENTTLTVTNGATGEDGTDLDEDNESGDNTGDVLLNDTIYTGSKSVTAISHSNGNSDIVDASSTYSQSEGQPGSISGTYGTITIGADGSYKYVPNSVADALSEGELATDIFTYTMTDGSDTATATITITVLGVNDKPTMSSDLKVYLNERNRDGGFARTTENRWYTFKGTDFTQLFTDVDGDSLDRIKLIQNIDDAGGATSGDLVNLNLATDHDDYIIPTGSYADEYQDIFNGVGSGEFRMRFMPDNDEKADTTFTYQVHDGNEFSNNLTGYVNINEAPLANSTSGRIAGTVAAGGTSSDDIISLAVTDTDDVGNLRITGVASGTETSTIPDGSVGTSIPGTYGTLVLDENGSFTYTANPTNDITYGSTAFDFFNYTVKDNESSDDHNADLSGNQNAGSDALDVGQIRFKVAAHTNDAPTSTDNTVYVNENNTTLTPGEDPASLSSGDRTPAANLIKTFAASDFAFTDTNTGQTLKSIQIVDLPINGSLAVSGSAVSTLDTITYNNIQYLVYTPSVNSESNDSFTFKVIDSADEASANPYTMTIVNNAAPDVTNISASSIAAGGTSTGDVHDSVVDADDDDSDLVVTGLKTGSEASDSTAIITDGTGVAGSGVDGSYGTLVIAADGTYTYTASATNDIAYDATGTDTFTFTTRDDETNTDSNYAYDAGQITFTVGSSISLNTDSDAVNEDETIDTLLEGVDGVIDNDAADEDGLIVTSVTSNNTSNTDAAGAAVLGQYGILTLQLDGSYHYDTSAIAATDALTAGQQVTDVFTYEVDGGATSTLTITVTGLGPLAEDDAANVNEDATVTGDGYSDNTTNDGVIENDDEGGASYESEHSTLTVTQAKPDGGSYTTVSSGGSANISGTYGTLTLYSTGQYSYTPDNSTAQALDDGASATETFVYEINDDGENASTANLVITINGVNDDIVAIDDEDEVDEGSSVLRGNTSAYSLDYDDTDVDTADTYSTHEITAIRTKNEAAVDGTDGTIATPLEGDYGRLTVFADGSYNYQANNNIMISGSRMVSGQSVTDVFTYTVADGNGSTDKAILTITINGTDEPPITADDYTTVNVEDGSVTINSENGVTVNDADIEGDITVTGIENSSGNTGTIGSPLAGNYGNLVLNTDGSYTYTIDTNNTEINKIPEGGSFIEQFTYTITDEAGQTETATIFIKINGKNDAPEAVDDTDELDLNTTTSVSRDLGSDYVVTSDDNDIDLNDYVYIQSFRTGESSGSGTSGTLNSSLSGTYGSLNLSNDGTYVYTSNSGLADTLDPGQSVYDYFTYTISDSQGATAYAQLTIRLFGPEAETETETETETEIEIDHRDLDNSYRNLVQRASLTGKDPYELPDRTPSASSNFYEGQFKIATFSENLKLVDLRAQFKDKDGNYTTFSDGSPDDILVLQFSVFNDPGIELVRYKGEMKDGSALPSWIKVNPKSGVVVTEIPPDVDLLEFKVIGIDDKNNEFEIAVVIDAGELRQNRELAKEFAGEIDENISVNEDGDVEVQSDEEQTNNETENKSLNGNEVKIKSKKQINDFVKGDVFKPKPYLRDNKYIINLPDEIKDNLEKGIAVLRNGEKAPKWVKVSLGKGELILDPPKNLKNLDLKIITMDQEGNKISNEIKSKINKRSAERFAKQVEIKEQSKFVSLNDQVGNENFQLDNYGEDILRRL